MSPSRIHSSIVRAGFALLAAGLLPTLSSRAADAPGSAAPSTPLPPWQAMNYGPFMSATLEVAHGNIANKGIAIRLDPGPGGIARGREFFLFDTDTLRGAAGWIGPDFINWKNIAMDGTHEVHASIVGDTVFSNPDAPGWADPSGRFVDARIVGRDGQRYGPLPRTWSHWRGLYVSGNHVVLSYTVGETEVLESPAAEGEELDRALTRTFNVGPRSRPLVLQVAQSPLASNSSTSAPSTPLTSEGNLAFLSSRAPDGITFAADVALNADPKAAAVVLVGAPAGVHWSVEGDRMLRLQIPVGPASLQFKVLYVVPGTNVSDRAARLAQTSPGPRDLHVWTKGGSAHWAEPVTTRVERIADARLPYQLESITLPVANPYHSWMRLGGFDFFSDPSRAAVCTWQGDVWTVDGLGGQLESFHWKRIASGLFQPLGLKIVHDTIYVTCRDEIVRLRDLNGDGATDFYENFNNDAQVTEHFHEFALDLQTDAEGNFYYAKAGRHAKDALVPQHGTLLRVSPDGAHTEIVANGFRAPNGVCVNGDGTFIVSDQEGHWTPENRIDWVKPGGFYGYMMGYHEPRRDDDFEPPVVWIHKSLDRSPSEQIWVTNDRWGLPKGSLISLSYGTGKIFEVLHERVGDSIQGAVVPLPIPAAPTGLIRGRFHPVDGQLYAAGLFGWAGDKTQAGGFYRVRYTGKPLHIPTGLQATRQGMVITFNAPLDPDSAGDPGSYAVTRWTLRRTANYGSDDYRISNPKERGRDSVEVTGAQLSPDKRSVLLVIPDLKPCMEMEIKYEIQASDGATLSQTIENTIQTVGGDCSFSVKH